MQRDNASWQDEGTPGVPITKQSLLGVIAIDEDKVDRVVQERGVHAAGPYPLHTAVANPLDFVVRDSLLHAEAKAANRERIDRGQTAIAGHDLSQSARGDAMPDADFDEAVAAARVTCQTVAFGFCRLRFGRGQTYEPGGVVTKDSHATPLRSIA